MSLRGMLGELGRTRAGWAASNIGKLAAYGASRAWGNPMARAAMIGAGAGGAYGALDSNTSVLGGALMGAGLGAGGYRYGGAGIRKAATRWNTAAGQFASGAYGAAGSTLLGNAGAGIWSAIRSDAMRVKLFSNKGYSKIRSTLKGWRS